MMKDINGKKDKKKRKKSKKCLVFVTQTISVKQKISFPSYSFLHDFMEHFHGFFFENRIKKERGTNGLRSDTCL